MTFYNDQWYEEESKKGGVLKAINKNLLISFEFMTKKTNCALYSMDNTDEMHIAYSDKHIVIKDGHLATKFYG